MLSLLSVLSLLFQFFVEARNGGLGFAVGKWWFGLGLADLGVVVVDSMAGLADLGLGLSILAWWSANLSLGLLISAWVCCLQLGGVVVVAGFWCLQLGGVVVVTGREKRRRKEK